MSHGLARRAALFVLAWPWAVAGAAHPVDVIISSVSPVEGRDGWIAVDLLLVNDGSDDESFALPDRLEASVSAPAAGRVLLDRAPGMAPALSVPAHGFARARYCFERPAGGGFEGALVSIPALGTQQVAYARPLAPGEPVARSESAIATAASPMKGPAPAPPYEARREALAAISPYQPVYAAYGTIEDSEIKIQLSFKYRLAGGDSEGTLWRDGLYFGYTQLMLWDRAGDSEFHDVNYMPELFYRSRPVSLGPTVAAGLHVGLRHESNGRSGPLSRSLNIAYVGSAIRWDLGDGIFVSAEPRLSFLVGGRHDNPDIRSYRGVTGLNLAFGRKDSFQLSAYSRYNFSTGRGAVTTQVSYPLARVLGGGPQLYLFGENFAGYGETLRDYDRRMTRLRIGLAVVR